MAFASKCILAKVVTVLPMYMIQTVVLPKQVGSRLESMMRQFVWGGMKGTRKYHSICWNNFCFSKDEGVMGFRDLCQV